MNHEAQVKKQQKREADELKQRLNDIKTIGATPSGLRLFNWILGLTGLYSSCFTGNSTTFFNEGKRDIGLQILEAITEADAEIYVNILRENSKNGRSK